MSQILKMTPAWVYFLFLCLLYFGFVQSRRRELSRVRLFVIPAVMSGLSIWSVWESFGATATGFSAWSIALILAVLPGISRLRLVNGVAYNRITRRYVLPGSWIPLVLIMAIFATEYFVNASIATKVLSADIPEFVAISSSILGFLSGTFLARALHVYANGKLNGARV